MLSVIVPTYKNSSKLQFCLDALIGQSLEKSKYEIIVVDNGPCDKTKEVCANYPRCRYLIEEKPGSYSARNKGIRESVGRIIAFTDSDCIPDSNWLKSAFEIMHDTSIDLLSGRVNVVVSDAKNVYELFDKKNGFKQFTYFSNGHYGATANLFVKKETFEKFGMFDDSLFSCGDREFGQRVVSGGGILSYNNNVLVNHPARSTLNELFLKRIRIAGGMSIIKKHDKIFEENFNNSVITQLQLTIINKVLKSISSIFLILYKKGVIKKRRRV